MVIVYILTTSLSAGFLQGQLRSLRASGFRPIICAPDLTNNLRELSCREQVDLVECPMRREISPIRDFISYWKLVWILHRLKPAITVTIGPKAGLLGGLAAATSHVPCRVQTKWGIRLETTRGLLRLALIITDKIGAACSHRILCDSESGRYRTAELGLAPIEKISVIGTGSANGIDVTRFDLSDNNLALAKTFRTEIGAHSRTPVVGFVGRLSRDKGLGELLLAWPLIKSSQPDAVLALIGPAECSTALEHEQLLRLRNMAGVRLLGHRSHLEGVFAAFDVLLLPSHREGFGVVVLEAAATGVPTVGFAVTGMRDSIVANKTGALVKFGDHEGLAREIVSYLTSASLRLKHGVAGRKRVVEKFQQVQLWHGYFNFFKEQAELVGLPVSGLRWVEPATTLVNSKIDNEKFASILTGLLKTRSCK